MPHSRPRFRPAWRVMGYAVAASWLSLAMGCADGALAPTEPLPAPSSPALALWDGTTRTDIESQLAPTKCLTVRGSVVEGSVTELQPCDGREGQQFVFGSDGMVRIGSNLCLDAFNARGLDGDEVGIWTCHGGSNQRWRSTSVGELRGINEKCIDVNSGRGIDGQPIIIWTCHGGSNQRWTTDDQSSATPPTSPTPTPTPEPVATVAVTLGSAALAVGQTTQAAATLRDAAGAVLTGRAVTWASSDAAVASVSPTGLVTARAAGTAAITATSEGQSGAATLGVAAAPPPASCALVRDWTARPTTALAKPGYLQAVTEPDFGTRLIRVTGDPGTPIGNGVAGTWPQLAGVSYAKRQAWSADGAYLMIGEMAGAVGGGFALILDGTTYQPVRTAGPAPSYVWHPTAPDVLIGVTGTGSVVTQNVRTGATATRVGVSGYSSATLGQGEGNPSEDGRYVPVVATRTADGRRVVYVADVQQGTKSPDIDVAAQGFSPLDWAGVSASGAYVYLFGTIGGAWARVKVYDRATLALVQYWTDYPMGHTDLGRTEGGVDVAFGAAGITGSPQWVGRRLDTGALTVLSPSLTANWHASNRNTARWGWGYGVTNNATGTPLDAEVYALRLDGSRAIERFGHHRSNITDYEAHPFAVPSPDGKRIAFRSNWGAAGGRPIATYVLDTRQLCQ